MAFVTTTRPNDARQFYENALGLRFIEDTPFALIFDAAGTTLRIAKVESHTPLPGTVLGWRVTDVRAAVHDLMERGVKFERYDVLDQDDLGVWVPPGGARAGAVAWFKDPDGNLLSLSSS
jgi:catechol 2,3-dioxygenase-like lactoylglutathione lyase family enzyme